jgi:hypothetical protein
MREWLLAVALALAPLSAAADGLGTFTILEGQALIYRGSGRLSAAEGVRLAAGDIVETAPSTFAQVELPDRTIVQLGPSTRLMMSPAAPRQKPDRSLYLLEGWLKLMSTRRDATAGPGLDLRAPAFELPAGDGVIVLHSTPSELRLFAESGAARVGERQKSGAPVMVSLRAGDYYQRKPPARGSVAASVPQAFIDAIPRAFRDSLPARLDRFRERAVTPREAPGFGYQDVEDWLKAEPPVRRALMQRWRARASDPPFRAGLVSNLSSHPEWDPILFPEKYRPKEPPVPPRPAQAP